ncbi:MAG: YkoF family thiamine/hydroxymethylpyrimidine-binding protein [Gammaproteobacteria bacterium]|nr:YkoF family thiamine/hydroxymethylpyrimidine-binding protein [Gammaproteobacteria bacterium]
MRITAELSLYPLQEDFVTEIRRFIEDLRTRPGLEITTNQMSTQIRGDFDAVTGAITAAMRTSFTSGESMSLVVKYLNADLPIGSPPNV